MWYRKSVLPGTGAGGAELKSIKKKTKIPLSLVLSRKPFMSGA